MNPPAPTSPNDQAKIHTISCCDVILLVGSIALIVIGSLWVAGMLTHGGYGVILPGYSFGATVEGGFCIAVGGIALAVILGRMCSPRFREFTNIDND